MGNKITHRAGRVRLLQLATVVGLLLWAGQYLSATAFNLDTINFILQEGEPNSMFGFSVALHREQNKSWVIVGAPTANTTQPDVIEGGAVYRCDIYEDHRCYLVPFDTKGNNFNDQNEQIDTKSNQWFGATVASAGIDGPLVACAPRYVFHQLQPRKAERVEPVGTCHIAKNNMREFQEFSPCRTAYWGYHRQGSCQAGFSAALTNDGTRVFIGAPGSYYWQGQIYSFTLNNPKDKVYKTLEDKKDEDDSYLGYSATTGDFDGDGTQGVAVGKPRGAGLLGKVLLYSWNMTNQQNITGEQIGAYFGYSLASVDVDGDRLEDLIIGAPMHTEPNNEGKYETGRVYIMYQGADRAGKFRDLETRDGTNSRARFGLAVCSLADLNLDGYGDFAVGAPYDGSSGRGAVYVFYGSRDGPLPKASQVIQAEEMAGVTRLTTFGFSLSGGIDLDGNRYPDLVVGAYESDKALVFKARPVAAMEASTLFEAENKLISLDERNCTVARTPKPVPCTVVNSCLKYNGINVPPMLDIEISWTLDARQQRSPRMFFLSEEGRNTRIQSMRLYRGKLECRSERVYIADAIRDKITPLEVEMTYRLLESAGALSRQRRPRANIEPVLDANRGTVQRDAINIQKNCGPDNVCVPDLHMEIRSVDNYLLGSNNLLSVEVFIINQDEDAFEAGFYMVVPPGLDFRRVDRLGEVKDVPVLCTAPSTATNKTLKCDIGNPLSRDKVVNFKVILAPSLAAGSMGSSYDFYMEANSTNPEGTGRTHDNVLRKSIGILVQTDLAMSGVSLPSEFLYNYTEYKPLSEATNERELGHQVVNIYEIRNEGPSTIDEAEFYVLWPHETIDGVPLMYLLNQPETHGNIQCQPTEYVNPLNVAIDGVLARKSFLDKVGVSGTSFSSTAGSRTAKINSVASGAGVAGSASYLSAGHSTSASTGRSQGASETRFASSSSSFSSSSSSMGIASEGAQIQRVSSESGERRYQTEGRSEFGGAMVNNANSRQGALSHRADEVGVGNRMHHHDAASSAGSTFHVDSSISGKGTGASGGAAGAAHYASSGALNGSTSSAVVYYVSKNRTTYQGEDGRVHVSESSEYHNKNLGIGAREHASGSLDPNTATRYNQGQSPLNGGDSSSATSGSSTRRRMYSLQDGDKSRSPSGTLVTDFLDVGTMHGGATNDHGRLENKFKNEYSRNTLQQHSASGGTTASSSAASFHATSGSSSLVHGHYSKEEVESATFSSNAYNGIADENEDEDYDTYDNSDDGGFVDTEMRVDHHQQQQQTRDSTFPPGYGLSHLKQAQLNQGHENVEQRFKYYQRFDRQRRQADPDQAPDLDRALEEALKCHATRCAIIHCVAGPIGNKDVAFVALRTRVVAHTLHQLSSSTPLHFSTMIVARVTKLPYIGQPKEKPIKTHEIQVLATPEPTVKPDVVPLWIVVLAACAGALILLLLIYLLSKCGFFERNRPTDSSERQPLNRNGNYHGDEHL
uniref:Uncharacterized protein n=1 Tax=Anopheles atroparvus TaxID=41427 RepID=A0A182JLT4_ANOAO